MLGAINLASLEEDTTSLSGTGEVEALLALGGAAANGGPGLLTHLTTLPEVDTSTLLTCQICMGCEGIGPQYTLH